MALSRVLVILGVALSTLLACAEGLKARAPAARRPAPALTRAVTVRSVGAVAGSAFASALLAGMPRSANALELPGFVKDQMGANAERPFDVGGGGRRNGKSGYLVRAAERQWAFVRVGARGVAVLRGQRAPRQWRANSRAFADSSALPPPPRASYPSSLPVVAEPVPVPARGPLMHLHL